MEIKYPFNPINNSPYIVLKKHSDVIFCLTNLKRDLCSLLLLFFAIKVNVSSVIRFKTWFQQCTNGMVVFCLESNEPPSANGTAHHLVEKWNSAYLSSAEGKAKFSIYRGM